MIQSLFQNFLKDNFQHNPLHPNLIEDDIKTELNEIVAEAKEKLDRDIEEIGHINTFHLDKVEFFDENNKNDTSFSSNNESINAILIVINDERNNLQNTMSQYFEFYQIPKAFFKYAGRLAYYGK